MKSNNKYLADSECKWEKFQLFSRAKRELKFNHLVSYFCNSSSSSTKILLYFIISSGGCKPSDKRGGGGRGGGGGHPDPEIRQGVAKKIFFGLSGLNLV